MAEVPDNGRNARQRQKCQATAECGRSVFPAPAAQPGTALLPAIALTAIVARTIAPGQDCKQPDGSTSVGIGSSVVICAPIYGSSDFLRGSGGETGFEVHSPIALLEDALDYSHIYKPSQWLWIEGKRLISRRSACAVPTFLLL